MKLFVGGGGDIRENLRLTSRVGVGLRITVRGGFLFFYLYD